MARPGQDPQGRGGAAGSSFWPERSPPSAPSFSLWRRRGERTSMAATLAAEEVELGAECVLDAGDEPQGGVAGDAGLAEEGEVAV